MPRDDLSVLAAFAVVADERSFTRAAVRLGVSTSAIRHSIRGLEERLGVRLLARTTRTVAPTDAGQRLLARLQPALENIDGALAEVDAGVEAAGDQVAPDVVLAREVEYHVGIVAGELRQLRPQHRRQHDRRRDRADDAGRLRTEPAHVDERRLDVAEGRTELREQALSRVRGRDGARGPREEPQSEALLERAYRMADRGPKARTSFISWSGASAAALRISRSRASLIARERRAPSMTGERLRRRVLALSMARRNGDPTSERCLTAFPTTYVNRNADSGADEAFWSSR